MKAKCAHTRWHRAITEHQRDALDDHESRRGAGGSKADNCAAACVTYDITSGVGGGVAGPGDSCCSAIGFAVNGEAAITIANA